MEDSDAFNRSITTTAALSSLIGLFCDIITYGERKICLNFTLNSCKVHTYIHVQMFGQPLVQELQRQCAGGVSGPPTASRLLHHAGRLREVCTEQPCGVL